MGTNLKLFVAAMTTLFFGTNLVVCVTANLEDPAPSPVETEFSAKPDSQTLVATSSNDDFDIDPLPANIFTAEVSGFLSPDMFWQADPLIYFLKKTKKIPYQSVRSISVMVENFIQMPGPKFPQRYIPYADFVKTLLSCLILLHDIEESTRRIRLNNFSALPDIFNLDPILSPLFSSYVFSDKNPPNRLLLKMTEIPENELESIADRIQNLINNRYFPRLYSRFAKFLSYFFKAAHFYLRKLKTKIVQIREVASAIPQDKLQIDNEIDLPAEDSDSTAYITQPSDNPTAAISNNASDADNSLNRIFRKEVRNFLSPDMFSHTNPVAYLLTKASKLPKDVLRHTSSYVTGSLDHEEFPSRYLPYAKLASSILSCLEQLENINEFIEDYQRTISYYSYFSLRDVSKFGPELSQLFSNDIFAKGNPRSRILIKLLNMPDNEISTLANKLQDHLDDRSFPTRYRRYANLLMEVLRRDYLILRLKDDIAEIRRTPELDSLTPQTLDQPISTTVRKIRPSGLSASSNGSANFAMQPKFQRLHEFSQKTQ